MLWERGGGIWHIKWREVKRYPDGRIEYIQHCESTRSTDKKFAQRCLYRRLQEVGGRRPMLVDPRKVSYSDLRENLLNACVEKGIRTLKRDADRQPTLATLPRLDEYFGSFRAAEISIGDLRLFRVEGKRDGLSDARLNRYMATLRGMFRQAMKDELITRTEMPAYFPMTEEKNIARGAVYIRPEWYAPLCHKLKEPLRSAFILSYAVGIRVGELERIRWRDIDTVKRVVTLPGEATKTGNPRLVPLPTDFKRKPGRPDELVFQLGNYRWAWYKACVAVGAGKWEDTATGRKKYVGILLRHCRHSAIRNMSDAGMDRTRIMAISGHATDSMFHRYNIGLEKDVGAARKAIEQYHKTQQRRL